MEEAHTTGWPDQASNCPGWVGFLIGGRPGGNRFITTPQDVKRARRNTMTCATTSRKQGLEKLRFRKSSACQSCQSPLGLLFKQGPQLTHHRQQQLIQ